MAAMRWFCAQFVGEEVWCVVFIRFLLFLNDVD